MVFAVAQPTAGAPRDVALNVSGLLWQNNRHVDADHYRAAVIDIVERLLDEGRSVTLLPHVLESPDPDNDLPAVRAVADRFGGAVEVAVPEGLDDARSLVAGARVVIGARMHACLNALSTGTPAVAMAYSRKFRPLLRELDWNHVVDIAEPKTTADAVIEAVATPGLEEQARRTQLEGQRRIEQLRSAVAALQ
jgi:polysaccharide pyruvyl transferase WcaK-like protein